MIDGVVSIPLSGQSLHRGKDSSGGRKPAVLHEFVAGPENRLVEVAARAVLDGKPNGYSPLVLYGPPGTGKSLLARGLALEWESRFPNEPAVYVTAVDFARHLTDSIEAQSVDEFCSRHRGAALLVIEDVGHLVGKRTAQGELLHTIDAVADFGGQTLLTADAAPRDMSGIMPALRSRLVSGLSIPLAPPGLEARLVILRSLAKLRGMTLAEPAVRILAEGLPTTVPELAAALMRLDVLKRKGGALIDRDTARLYLAQRDLPQAPELHEIALATAQHFSLRIGQLRSASRRRAVVTARGVAMYLARKLTPGSLEQIGNYFGGRDHTTALYGCRKTERLLRTDLSVRLAVQRLLEQFQATSAKGGSFYP